jgi:hypothetical protein
MAHAPERMMQLNLIHVTNDGPPGKFNAGSPEMIVFLFYFCDEYRDTPQGVVIGRCNSITKCFPPQHTTKCSHSYLVYLKKK